MDKWKSNAELNRLKRMPLQGDGITIIKPAPFNLQSFERETDTLMNDCRKGETLSYIALYNYLSEVKKAVAHLKRASWKKIYIKPFMFPNGKEPEIIHEDDRGTYYYEEERKNA